MSGGMRSAGSFCLFLALFAFFCLVSAESRAADPAGAGALSVPDSSDTALRALEGAIQANPEQPEAYERYGYLLMEKGRLDEAIAAFSQALQRNPLFRSAQAGLGLAFVRKGELKKAEPILQEALMLNTDPALAYYALGLLYEKLGDYRKAILHFKEGLRKVKGEGR
ncbi:MAG: tetratricopeptide repeat protein [Thermodesulfovibrionales bacterium]